MREVKEMTDKQKTLVYDSENRLRLLLDQSLEYPTITILGSCVVVPSTEKKFGDVESVQRYLDIVMRTSWFKERYPTVTSVFVKGKKDISHAHYQAGSIFLPNATLGGMWSMREIVVLHELAHHLARGDNHGARFTDAFQFLLANAVGEEAGFLLRSFLHLEGAK